MSDTYIYSKNTDFVNSLFQSSNPYHFVRQGEINSLAEASPAKRLKLLEDFAGTTVHKVSLFPCFSYPL